MTMMTMMTLEVAYSLRGRIDRPRHDDDDNDNDDGCLQPAGLHHRARIARRRKNLVLVRDPVGAGGGGHSEAPLEAVNEPILHGELLLLLGEDHDERGERLQRLGPLFRAMRVAADKPPRVLAQRVCDDLATLRVGGSHKEDCEPNEDAPIADDLPCLAEADGHQKVHADGPKVSSRSNNTAHGTDVARVNGRHNAVARALSGLREDGCNHEHQNGKRQPPPGLGDRREHHQPDAHAHSAQEGGNDPPKETKPDVELVGEQAPEGASKEVHEAERASSKRRRRLGHVELVDKVVANDGPHTNIDTVGREEEQAHDPGAVVGGSCPEGDVQRGTLFVVVLDRPLLVLFLLRDEFLVVGGVVREEEGAYDDEDHEGGGDDEGAAPRVLVVVVVLERSVDQWDGKVRNTSADLTPAASSGANETNDGLVEVKRAPRRGTDKGGSEEGNKEASSHKLLVRFGKGEPV
mmetsp:Transcript_17878/g.34945  ORF Transcript_17878/g.34945 Transcript_17878/m.34945 type:complete len:463 (-) Transcript_17878:899-2287(-)